MSILLFPLSSFYHLIIRFIHVLLSWFSRFFLRRETTVSTPLNALLIICLDNPKMGVLAAASSPILCLFWASLDDDRVWDLDAPGTKKILLLFACFRDGHFLQICSATERTGKIHGGDGCRVCRTIGSRSDAPYLGGSPECRRHSRRAYELPAIRTLEKTTHSLPRSIVYLPPRGGRTGSTVTLSASNRHTFIYSNSSDRKSTHRTLVKSAMAMSATATATSDRIQGTRS